MNSQSISSNPYPGLDTPALLIEKAIAERNIARMQELAGTHGITLRPHIKTHKMPEIVRWQLAAGAQGIAVAKLGEAEVMAAAGCDDIQLANQVVGDTKIRRLFTLGEKVSITCAVDSTSNVDELGKYFHVRNRTLPVLIELDCGLHRCGLDSPEAVIALAEHIQHSHGVRFEGLLTHAGHAYGAANETELASIGRYEAEFTVKMAEALKTAGLPANTLSVGSTPTARYAAAVAGITELRVGNYVFNDRMQVALGVAAPEDCALSILATVISTPTETRAIIDAGSKALALDVGAHGVSRLDGYGEIVGKRGTIARLSEEHGVITHDGGQYAVGQRLRIVPNHACVAVNLFDCAYLVDDEEVVGELAIEARGKMS